MTMNVVESVDMIQGQVKLPAPPKGVVAALVGGFEAVNARLELVLLPLVLDLALWLGPHVSIRPLIEGLAAWLGRLPSAVGQDPTTIENVRALQAVLADLAARYNVLSGLSTYPLGVPSLAAARAPIGTPWGLAPTWLVNSWAVYFGLWLATLLGGLLLGALYLGGIAQQVRDRRLSLRQLLGQVWGDWARLLALGTLAVALVLALGAPALLVSTFVAQINAALGGLISLVAFTVVMWVLLYGGFAVHGILLRRRGLLGALWDSARLVQFSLPQAAGLLVLLTVVSSGLGWVWNIPAEESWLLLLGLGGHALVSTALVAATFVFYQDRFRWLTEMGQALQARAEAERKRSGERRQT
jgi:hypothetical protein